MKAFIYEKYGPPETPGMAEVEKPGPNADEVLVKVLAVSRPYRGDRGLQWVGAIAAGVRDERGWTSRLRR